MGLRARRDLLYAQEGSMEAVIEVTGDRYLDNT